MRAQLRNLARHRSVEFQLMLSDFAIERLLYRLGFSSYSGRFGVKGATLFKLWSDENYRATRRHRFRLAYCYHGRFQGKMVLAPEYGGDGREVGQCADVGQPLVAFPAHWAPTELLFYDGQQYPARFRDDVFVVFHGSWNRFPLKQGGYQVAFAP